MKHGDEFHVDTALGVTLPAGFRAASAAVGVKKLSEKPDVAVLACGTEAAAAAVFTQNKVCAAPVTVSREHLLHLGGVRAVVANSGNANACTGEQGMTDARQMAGVAAEQLGCDARQVLVASTGVIGRLMPMDKVRAGIVQSCGGLAVGPEADLAFARAIMTTDTRPKQAGVKLTLRGRTVTVAGATKGVGMVNPNMATVLGFLTTDAAVSPLVLDSLLRNAVDTTYNCLTVDGHTSTNDTLILMASGLAFRDPSGPMIDPILERSSADAKVLADALRAVCCSLSRQIAADAEGGTKVIDVRVTGAATGAEARAPPRQSPTRRSLRPPSSAKTRTGAGSSRPPGTLASPAGRRRCAWRWATW